MRRRLVRPEDEEIFGPRSQEVEDVRLDTSIGTGQPPSVYPPQPPGIPGGWRNQSMPGREPMGGGTFAGGWNQAAQQHQDRPTTQQAMADPNWYGKLQAQGGQWPQENAYARQAYQTRTNDPMMAGIRNAMATPMDAPGMPPAWQQGQQQRNGGINPQRPGTGGPVDPRVATPESGYGWGGVQNPQYQNQNPQGQQAPNDYAALQAAAQRSMQGFTDIQGMRDVFKPGQFMGQLEGFNTNAWGSGERGSDTLKNMFGTIASNHDVTQPGALQRALVDIQKALPNATIVSHANEDLLDPDGPNGPLQPVDVIRGATAGGAGAAWQWGPLDQMGAPKPGMNGPQGPSNQVYNNAITQMAPQAGQPGGLAPQVQDENSAMDFLNWLMQQQQQQPLV